MASRNKIDTDAPPTSLQEAVDRLADPRAALVAIIDRAVRDARANSWCDAFESIMDKAAPELAVATEYDRRESGPGTTYVDSEGNSCYGFDVEGYNATTGLHYRTTLDREGYDRYGFHNETRLDRDGFDTDGNNPSNPAAGYRFAYSSSGRSYLTDWDGFAPGGSVAYNGRGDYINRRDLTVLRAQLGPEGFNLDRNGNRMPEAEASE